MPPVEVHPRRVRVVGPIISHQMRVVLLWPFEESPRAHWGVWQLPLWLELFPASPPPTLPTFSTETLEAIFRVFFFFLAISFLGGGVISHIVALVICIADNMLLVVFD